MVINFVGLFSSSGSGEISDETHIARSLEELGHIVRRIPRDEWREYVREDWPKNKYKGVPEELKADINIICKWPHFYDGSFISELGVASKAPVFYWSFDSIDLGIDWHRHMAQAANLYLSGELGRASEFKKHDIKFYYFQFDGVDGTISINKPLKKLYDVIYLGTFDNQSGRMDILKEINRELPIHVWGNGDWEKEGFIHHGTVFGEEANKVIAESKIVLGTSCDPHLYGYWSNRVGRILRANGFLLQQYTPGMENFLHGFVEYYSTSEEAIKKIRHFLYGKHENRAEFPYTGFFTSKQKVLDLTIMIERYLKENNGKDWLLP
jgi:hypothetical protein